MLESENLQKKYGRKWMLSKMLSFIMLLFKKKVINACVKSVDGSHSATFQSRFCVGKR